jgi:hypothetical protein
MEAGAANLYNVLPYVNYSQQQQTICKKQVLALLTPS